MTTSALRAIGMPLGQVKDVILLSKPRLSTLVMVTCGGGMWLAPGHITPARAILAVLATAAVVGAANALNCFLERDVDARMRRTRDRPLPAGRLDPVVAVALGLLVPVFALPLLVLSAGPVTAALALVALVTYVLVYTPMKRRSSLALLVGAVPGAIPPLMGWTTVTGGVGAGGLALFALLCAWQLPHFLAVSLYLCDDYARGGIQVFARVHGERRTRWAIAASTLLLLPVSLLLVPLGVAGTGYGITAGVLGTALSAYALAGLRGEGGPWARRFFLATLVYLTALFIALFLSR
ncbi:MAG: heme o synthase [Anaeromyxobacter sp.]